MEISLRGRFPDWFRKSGFNVGEGALDLLTALVTLVIIERAYGLGGLGIYTFLLSVFVLSRYFAGWGVSRYVERRLAMLEGRAEEQADIQRAGLRATIFMGTIAVVLFVLSLAYNTTHTSVDESALAYPVIGLAVFFHNINRLKVAALHGLGRNEAAVKILNMRKVLFLAAIFILTVAHVPPSFLVLGFLASEIALAFVSRNHYRFPRGLKVFSGGISRTLDEGWKGLFTDEALGFVLFIDFLVLGVYVPSWELGVYSEATIIGRFFLLVPLSLRPILSRKYCMPSSSGGAGSHCLDAQRTAKVFFFTHAVLALYFEIFFAGLVKFLFFQESVVAPFRVFSYIMPGLLLYSAIIAAEPLYEALGKTDTLRKLVTGILVLNLGLNLYLVPYAGFIGSAVATSLSLVVYFLFFGMGLEKQFRAFKVPILVGGGGIYLCYTALKALSLGTAFNFFAAPAAAFALLWITGYFADSDIKREYSDMKANA